MAWRELRPIDAVDWLYGLLIREVPPEVGMAEARHTVDTAIDEAVMRRAALSGQEAPPTAAEAEGLAALLAMSGDA